MNSAIREYVEHLLAQHGSDVSATIPLLQAVQADYRYLPRDVLEAISELSDISLAHLSGVSTFYSQFRHMPAGKHTIAVCHGTACHVKGAPGITQAVLRFLGIEDGDTDAAGEFTVEKVACLGCCTLAPAVKIDEITYGHLRPETVGDMIDDFRKQRDAKQHPKQPPEPGEQPLGEILIGLGSCCVSRGSGLVKQAVDETLAELNAPVRVKRVGCVGMCHQTPLLEIHQPGKPDRRYANVHADDARRIIRKHFHPRGLLRNITEPILNGLDLLLTDENWAPPKRFELTPRDPQVAHFLGPQLHLANEYCGQTDPLDLEEYRAAGGFESFHRAVSGMTPQQVIQQITQSNLRGRGGGGFPTGVKWRHVADAEDNQKYVVCNGDEGDPGAFMDRMLLESHPFRILEGMAIAAYAVGATKGVLYIRAEYPLAVSRVQNAIEQCYAAGLLGQNIFGSEMNLDLRIMQGAGAFVCGEETALLASIEGNRGMPRFRPPYPAKEGLWGKPTLVNNVETYSLTPWILREGAEAFAQLGTPGSTGTKVFALAGKINRGGLIEVPMGITIRQIVEEIGGGVQNGKALKAVQVGGPSGGCVPAELADTPIDYDALQSVGSMMGSGGLVVLDEDDCMVDIARYFLEFTQDQSCGRCTFCRLGTRRMLEILNALCLGQAMPDDLDRLEELAKLTKQGSLCGLGKTAPNPVLSTLKYFRQEYEAHLLGHCPAGVCQSLTSYHITDKCIGCTLCAQHCPVDAIQPKPLERHEINQDKCIRCGACKTACPAEAIIVADPAAAPVSA